MGRRIPFIAISFVAALCILAGFGATPRVFAGDQGFVLAQGPPGGPPPGAPPQGAPGGAGGNACIQSHQRCVMMCAGVGNCVNNCNIGFAMCQQQQQQQPQQPQQRPLQPRPGGS